MLKGSLALFAAAAVAGSGVAAAAEVAVCHSAGLTLGVKHDRTLLARDGGRFGGASELLLEPQVAALSAPETNKRVDPALPSFLRLKWANEVDPVAAYVKHVPALMELQTSLRPKSGKPVTLSLEVGSKTFGPYAVSTTLKLPVGAYATRLGSQIETANVVLPPAELALVFKSLESSPTAVILTSEAGVPVARVTVPVPALTPLRYAANKWLIDSAKARAKGVCAPG